MEGTQLIFKGHEQSIDAVAAVDEETFVTGSQDGCVAFWSTQKKKPTKEVPSCHGGALPWVCAVGALYRSDLVASGRNRILLIVLIVLQVGQMEKYIYGRAPKLH